MFFIFHSTFIDKHLFSHWNYHNNWHIVKYFVWNNTISDNSNFEIITLYLFIFLSKTSPSIWNLLVQFMYFFPDPYFSDMSSVSYRVVCFGGLVLFSCHTLVASLSGVHITHGTMQIKPNLTQNEHHKLYLISLKLGRSLHINDAERPANFQTDKKFQWWLVSFHKPEQFGFSDCLLFA